MLAAFHVDGASGPSETEGDERLALQGANRLRHGRLVQATQGLPPH